MSKKINMVFDATLLLQVFDEKTASRSGIFFVSYNLLTEFTKNDGINIALYSNNSEFYKKWDILKSILEKDVSCKDIKLAPTNLDNKYSLKINELKPKKVDAKSKKQLLRSIELEIRILFNSILLRFSKESNEKSYFYKKIDVYFSPMRKVPDFLDQYTNVKQYIVLYDIIPILFQQYFGKFEYVSEDDWFKQLYKSLDGNKKYFPISKATKNDFLKFVPQLKDSNLIVTPLAVSTTFSPCPKITKKSLEKYNLSTDRKYVFTLCTLAPYKNLIRAVKTFIEFIKKNNIDDLVLILGGGHYDFFIDQLDKKITDSGSYKDKIIKAGYIDDEDLAPLYSSAQWFVYTSEYEGFGLPPLEAMSCGCPVITSNNSSLPEVVGDAGIMIDFDSDEQHIEAYEKYYFDDEYRKEMAQKGLERSKQFSWEKCANIMIKEMT